MSDIDYLTAIRSSLQAQAPALSAGDERDTIVELLIETERRRELVQTGAEGVAP